MSYNNKNVSEAVPGGVPEAATPVANKLTEWRAEILPQLETVRVEMAPRIERLVPPQVSAPAIESLQMRESVRQREEAACVRVCVYARVCHVCERGCVSE